MFKALFLFQRRDESDIRCVYLEERDKCVVDPSSVRGGTLTMPPRERLVLGEEAPVCNERTAFTHIRSCEHAPPPSSHLQLGAGKMGDVRLKTCPAGSPCTLQAWPVSEGYISHASFRPFT